MQPRTQRDPPIVESAKNPWKPPSRLCDANMSSMTDAGSLGMIPQNAPPPAPYAKNQRTDGPLNPTVPALRRSPCGDWSLSLAQQPT